MGLLTRFPVEKSRPSGGETVEQCKVHQLPGSMPLSPAGVSTAPAPLSKERALTDAESGGSRAAPAPVHPKDHPNLRLLETAATLVSLARTAASGEFSEDVHRAACIVSQDLTLIGCCEHDRSLHRACTLLVTALMELSEADSERREIWARALAPLKALVRELHFALSKRMGLA